ncbi:ABC transporter related [Staphylothermus marinus F1]|uniref:ABC transporter related n=1 Tax=Staphylothermus marinus (strain ATCC 43588 / DSM 3639 / JCM 9404 / F1) TaxID=399550 RepID=A3DKR4_STAMF|nr:ABC transporter ATP-binding protein [Staphylothermus marinus]ABN69224.1 ABC transporter related [Staphylothermus marinus F1]
MVEVRLERVTKIFRNKVVGVKDITLTIKHGEFLALLGPSGSGKSTTLYLIAGIYKPTNGKIFFDDRDVTNLPPKDRNVGLVFQNWALYPHMKVYDNISFPLRLKKMPENEIRRKVLEVAKMLKIEKLLDRYPWQLSGGQQQRVAIARALVKEPDVLLLDEPLSNLDAILRISVRAELKRLQKSLGITTIYVTHDQAEALAMADRIALINEGKIVQVGTPEEIYNKPASLFVGGFLGNPPMNFLDAEVEYLNNEVYLVVHGNKIHAPPQYKEILRKLGLKKVIIGFRPEDTNISPKTIDTICLSARIYAVEPMGRENIVVAEIADQLVKIITGRTLILYPDQIISICPAPERIVLFDPKTGYALEKLFITREK